MLQTSQKFIRCCGRCRELRGSCSVWLPVDPLLYLLALAFGSAPSSWALEWHWGEKTGIGPAQHYHSACQSGPYWVTWVEWVAPIPTEASWEGPWGMITMQWKHLQDAAMEDSAWQLFRRLRPLSDCATCQGNLLSETPQLPASSANSPIRRLLNHVVQYGNQW